MTCRCERGEPDKTEMRGMTALLKDDTELFKQFSDTESFRRWLTDTVFGLTYRGAQGGLKRDLPTLLTKRLSQPKSRPQISGNNSPVGMP